MRTGRCLVQLSLVCLFGGALAVLGCHGAASEKSAPAPEAAAARVATPDLSRITARDLQAHIDFLASDELLGRDSGQKGADVAAKYIATYFERLGLKPVGSDWEIAFDLPGGAGPATAEIQVGERKFNGASVVMAPNCSAAATVTARVVTDSDAEHYAGEIVLVEGTPTERDMRRQAEPLLGKGAGAVVFAGTTPWLTSARAGGDFRRMADELPGITVSQSGDDHPGGATLSISGDPSEWLNKLIGGGDDHGDAHGQVVVSFQIGGGDSDVQVLGDAGGIDLSQLQIDPSQLQIDTDSSAPMMMFGDTPGSRLRLSGPVVSVCEPVGAALRTAAEAGEMLTIRVTRPGRDSSCNVLARLEGADPQLKNEFVVIGGHYDHVGTDGKGNIWNGADDNASGTSAMLEIAEAYTKLSERPKRSLLFVAWGAEERGLVGSSAFGRDPAVPFEQIVSYINLDMVGRNDPASVELLSASETLNGWAEEAAATNGLTAKHGQEFFLNASDSGVFVQHQVPTVFFFTGMHADYHKPSDDPQTIDADKAARIARSAAALAWRAANEPQRPAFTPPKMNLPGMQVGSPERGRRLGIYPADGDNANGVRVDGVVPRSIAARAGIKKGDRIVRIGAEKLEKSGKIREILGGLPADQPFEIEIRRAGAAGEETLVLKGTFEDTAPKEEPQK